MLTVVEAFLSASTVNPGASCITSDNLDYSYAEVRRHILTLAAFLQQRMRLRVGEAVVVICDTDPQWLVISLALQLVGAVEIPVSTLTPVREVNIAL